MLNIPNETLFSIVGLFSFFGWIALLFSPLKREPLVRIAQVMVVVLALSYIVNLLVNMGLKPLPDFSTLAGVSKAFTYEATVLTGWVHFLAFDLFLGIWEVQKAAEGKIPHIAVIPCLLFTFMLGPVGFTLFLIVLSIKKRRVTIA